MKIIEMVFAVSDLKEMRLEGTAVELSKVKIPAPHQGVQVIDVRGQALQKIAPGRWLVHC
jgi:hypothetical protein